MQFSIGNVSLLRGILFDFRLCNFYNHIVWCKDVGKFTVLSWLGGYIIGLDDLYQLDLAARTWTELTGQVFGSRPAQRGGHNFLALNGELYAFGGTKTSDFGNPHSKTAIWCEIVYWTRVTPLRSEKFESWKGMCCIPFRPLCPRPNMLGEQRISTTTFGSSTPRASSGSTCPRWSWARQNRGIALLWLVPLARCTYLEEFRATLIRA